MGKKHKKTPPALKKAAENKRYVSAVHGNKIYYTKEFYRAMYDAVHNGKGAVDAYASLGFDVRELGEDRAFAAARRAEQMSETGFAKMTDFDGTRARSEYGKLTPDEEIAYYKARNLYLEMLIKLEKKNNSNWRPDVSCHRSRKRRRTVFDGISGLWIAERGR